MMKKTADFKIVPHSRIHVYIKMSIITIKCVPVQTPPLLCYCVTYRTAFIRIVHLLSWVSPS